MLLVAERTRLADVIERWLHRQRLTKAHVSKHGGVSTNTIWLIQQGTTTSPELETLRKVARGLATDPHSAEFDAQVYIEALRDMAGAAGFPEPAEALPTPDLESALRSTGLDRQEAAFWADIHRRYPNATPDQKRMLKDLARAVFGAEGMARLGQRESRPESRNP